jgi:hypothetical protein
MLQISPEKVCFLIIKAREYDVKVAPYDPESGSNATDDSVAEILEDQPDDPTEQELRDAMAGLNDDELVEVGALMLLGRGDFSRQEWGQARQTAVDMARERPLIETLMQTPLLGDYLEEGLSAHGRSCEEFEIGRL